MIRKTKTNRESLTWLNWLAAAGFDPDVSLTPEATSRLFAAWGAGEDPSEYRAMSKETRDEILRRGPCEGEHISKLTCMKCGNTDLLKFRYVESIESYRQVLKIVGGKLQVNGAYKTGEGYDDGKDAHFECHAGTRGRPCLHRMPVPGWLEEMIDWV